jgi:hypothetical protein
LCGHDETALGDGGPFDGIALLDRLLVKVPGTTVGPGMAKDLPVCNCDRLFAALYLKYFGKQVEGTGTCRQCGGSFEVAFSLQDLLAGLENGGRQHASGPDEDGVYTLADGRRFRLPTTSDQLRVLGMDAEEGAAALLERCVVEGDPTINPELLQAGMDEVGPLLDLDVDAMCPECGVSERVRFDIQSYLLRMLTHEKRFLVREIHLIALAYGWRYEEILSLSREDRRAFAGLIQSEREGRRRVRP